MISQFDINNMVKDIDNIRSDWAIDITIKTPKPESEQPGWNKLMREFLPGSTILYDEQKNVDAEIRNRNTDTQLETNVGGHKIDDQIILMVSPHYIDDDGKVCDTRITFESIVIMDGNSYNVLTIRDKIGEIMVCINRLDGDK